MRIQAGILPAVLLFVLLIGCNRNEPKIRPIGVPATSVWVGGTDGGAFVDCTASQRGEPNACTVYNDKSGDVWASGSFALENGHGVFAGQLAYSAADAGGILLQNNFVLKPQLTPRPVSVPKSSLLAENGVYVDCNAEGADLYECSLFLAADGQRITSARYRCQRAEGGPPCPQHLLPKVADQDVIYLKDGGTLTKSGPPQASAGS